MKERDCSGEKQERGCLGSSREESSEKRVEQGSANFLCKGPESEYVRLCRL